MQSFIVIALAVRPSLHGRQSKLDINSCVKKLEQDSKKNECIVFMHLKIYPIAANHLVIGNGRKLLILHTSSLFFLCKVLEFWNQSPYLRYNQ